MVNKRIDNSNANRTPIAKRKKPQVEQKDEADSKPKHQSFKKLNGENTEAVTKAKNLKKSLRDTIRLLKKPNLSTQVKVEMERKLKALQIQIEESELEKKLKENRDKYKMVMFFEKKKVERKIKKIEKELMEIDDDDKKGSLELELLEANVDLNYILHFPMTEKYISLYPNNAAEDQSGTKSDIRKTEIREQIKLQVLEGKLPKKAANSTTFSKKDDITTDSIKETEEPKGNINNDSFFGKDEETDQEDDESEDNESEDNESNESKSEESGSDEDESEENELDENESDD
ncbi:hypothetical protein K502DRAFT_365525 [Neoconidiobolus thromboides FSU 785]|nr:hypothetical protein K502DRAFT_365525 [Neoconidiobolus thromboides FSU 785]